MGDIHTYIELSGAVGADDGLVVDRGGGGVEKWRRVAAAAWWIGAAAWGLLGSPVGYLIPT